MGFTIGGEDACTTACTSDGKNTHKSTDSDRLAVIADLLADLPETNRRGVIANLPTTDRVKPMGSANHFHGGEFAVTCLV